MSGLFEGLNEGGNFAHNIVNKVMSRGRSSNKSLKGSEGGGASPNDTEPIVSMHKGGVVRKTKNYRLKKGERVLTKGQYKKLRGK